VFVVAGRKLLPQTTYNYFDMVGGMLKDKEGGI